MNHALVQARNDLINKYIDSPRETAMDTLFSDVQDGFAFTTSSWNDIIRAGERERYVPDARAHRDEAARRVVICRLDDRPIEAAHWLACQRYLENNFQLGGFHGYGQN